jgi:hypothetical protein
MTDTSKIEPALSPEEWANLSVFKGETAAQHRIMLALNGGGTVAHMPATIALANAALSDDDPRKITWAMVDEIREAASFIHEVSEEQPKLKRIAAALASYLPPRGT